MLFILAAYSYLSIMLKNAPKPASHAEPKFLTGRNGSTKVKHDGHRLIVQRDGRRRVRLFTRNGHDWSERYPLIAEAAHPDFGLRAFVIDGEAVLLGVDGRSDFNGLHSRRHDDEVQFYAFDCLLNNGDDVRKLPLSLRKGNLARLLARPRRWHLPQRLRTGRDRTRSIPPCLPVGARGVGIEAQGPAVSRRPIAALGQGQEPAASGVQPGAGSVLTKAARHVAIASSASVSVRNMKTTAAVSDMSHI